MKKILFVAASFVLPMVPMIASAQITNPPTVPIPTNLSTATGVFNLLRSIIGVFVTIFWILAGFFILYAAFLYLTAGGDEEKVGKAQNTLKYAVIAVVVALLATVLPNLISSILGGAQGVPGA